MNVHHPDDGDRRTNEVWSTGRTMAYGYDDAHQLTSVAASRPSDAARYRYDAAGNPVDRAELGLDVTNSFNNLNQIVTGSWTGATVTVAGSVNYPAGSISVNGQPGTVYPDSSFDVAAVPAAPGTNTLTATYTGPAYTNAPMTATDTSTVVLGDTTYTHDANGNLTSDATFLYQYDLANQLTNVTRKVDSVSVLQCRYDALGRRVEAIRADGTTDRYVYFPGSFLVLAVLDETNAPKEFYTRGPDLSGTLDSAGGIGGILACTYASAQTSPLYHHSDLMGNIIALTDTSGAVTSTFRYTPFGQLAFRSALLLPRFLFSTKEFDSVLNLNNYGYRYYSPKIGIWLQCDAFQEEFDINMYRYVGNSPVIDWDALGLFPAKGKWYKQPLFGYQYDSRYYKKWLKKNPLTDKRIDQAMRKQLKRSCIGITCLNLGIYEGDPEISNCYSTLERAEQIRDEWNSNCQCQGKASNGEDAKAKIFAIKLWLKQGAKVSEDGLVDLSEWKITSDLRYAGIYFFNHVRFPWDFGFFDEESGFVINGTGTETHMVKYNDYEKWKNYMPVNYNMIVYCVSCNTLRSTK